MSRGAIIAAAAVLAALVLAQVTLVSFLPVPLAAPDLVVVAVLAVAHAHGARAGAVVGAGAGLALDLVPPAAGPLGGWMLVLAVTGAALGHVVATGRPGPFGSLLLVAGGAAAAVLGRAAVLWFAGTPVGTSALGAAAASGAWALLLAPAALLAVPRGATRRTAPVRAVPPELTAP